MAGKKKQRHQPPKKVTVPTRNAKRWQGLNDQRARLMEQAGQFGQMLDAEVRAWAEGVGVHIGENDQPPHYHLAENCTELRVGKPPEPQVINMKDLRKLLEKKPAKAARA